MKDNHIMQFNLRNILHEIQYYLPSQLTLKDFIHHNSLHAFQDEKFYEGIFRASKIFGFKVTLQLGDYRELFKLGRIKESVIERMIEERKGADLLKQWSEKVLYGTYDENLTSRVGLFRCDWKRVYKIDLDSLVHPLLYRILSAYLDQGISIWNFPVGEGGFMASLRQLERKSKISFFKTQKVRNLFLDQSLRTEYLLERIVGKEAYFEQYLYDLAFSHPGWSGMVATQSKTPQALLIPRPITLEELIHLELLMEWDMLDDELGEKWKPLAETALSLPIHILGETHLTELDEVLKIWQDAFEWSYYDNVIQGIKQNRLRQPSLKGNLLTAVEEHFQAIFCIDDRECSLRRHLESLAPHVSTYGAPGFFGVEFYYQKQGAKFLDKLCPAPVTPKHLIKESDTDVVNGQEVLLSKNTYQLFKGLFSTWSLGLPAMYKLFETVFTPQPNALLVNAFSQSNQNGKLSVENSDVNHIENGLQIGFTIDEMTQRVGAFLRNIGLVNQFGKNVYVVAHGSSTVNNPHHGAYECGACSGRPGLVNARVFAAMANHPEVRRRLSQEGLFIPDDSLFIAALHDTTSDQISYFEDMSLPGPNLSMHHKVKMWFENALDLNAKERSRRFATLSQKGSVREIRKAIRERSFSMFEPRPELGHGTNSIAVVGRRELSRGIFFDRRAFLQSYDFQTDPEGKYLIQVLSPISVVCGGINLEYYFSRVDNMKLGCGTKLPHHVMGLIGVTNSCDGDLRPGLSWQMIEPHDPIRLLIIVEHYPEVVDRVIRSNESLFEWYKNEWIHMACIKPDSGDIFYFRNGAFVLHHTEPKDIEAVRNVHPLFEDAPRMMTNHITHATFENLPVYQIEI